MIVLVLFFIFAAVPFFGCAAHSQRTESMLSLGFFSAIMLLYAFGIFGALEAGFWVVLVLAGLCYAGGLIMLIRSRDWKHFAHRFFSPVFWVWLLLFAVIWFTGHGKLVHFYDEFTHWGDVVKVMCQNDQLATLANARSLFSTYPPGMALLQYLTQKVNLVMNGADAYREDLLYMTAQWFMLSLYLPFTGKFVRRRPWKIAFAALSIFMLPLFAFRSSAYALIYIDSFLGMLGGFVLIYAFVCDENDPFERATLILSLMTLVLTKDVGIVFALGGTLVWCAGVCIRRGVFRKLDTRGVLRMLIVIGSVLITWFSWKMHIALTGAVVTQASFQQPVDFGELLAIATGTSAYPWRRTVLNQYINQFFQPIFYLAPSNTMVTHASLLLLTGGGLAWMSNVMAKREAEWARRFRWVCYSWCAVVAAYIAGMGILYLFKYNYEEAIILSAWNRYMDTLIAYGVFVFSAGVLYALKERLMSKNATIAVIILMLVMVPWGGAVDTLSRSEAENTQVSQKVWIELADEMRTISERDGVGSNARVYLVYEGDTQPFLSMRYRLRPMQVNDENWTLGQYNADPDPKETALTVEEMRHKLMMEYDYLILCAAEDQFAVQYGDLFALQEDIRRGGIYRVEKDTGVLQSCH